MSGGLQYKHSTHVHIRPAEAAVAKGLLTREGPRCFGVRVGFFLLNISINGTVQLTTYDFMLAL